MLQPFFLCFIMLLLAACSPSGNGDDHTQLSDDGVPFLSSEVAGIIQTALIQEASGLVMSRVHMDACWTHNDSGGEPKIYLISTTGESKGSYLLKGTENRDWEDIAMGPGPDPDFNYIYVGEIGDNNARYEEKKIFRFPEPSAQPGQNKVDTIQHVDVIRFIYPDGKRDAETLLVDPFTKDIYVISKRETSVHIYRAAYPQDLTKVITLEMLGQLPMISRNEGDQIVGGDISEDGKEVLLKAYNKIYYWKRDDQNTSIADLLKSPPVELPYVPEPQGEAITFATDGSGYYTLSEKNITTQQQLLFYKRK